MALTPAPRVPKMTPIWLTKRESPRIRWSWPCHPDGAPPRGTAGTVGPQPARHRNLVADPGPDPWPGGGEPELREPRGVDRRPLLRPAQDHACGHAPGARRTGGRAAHGVYRRIRARDVRGAAQASAGSALSDRGTI